MDLPKLNLPKDFDFIKIDLLPCAPVITDMFNFPRDSKDGFIQLSQSISLDDIRLLGLEFSKAFLKE